MNYVTLGTTGMKVSRLCFGTMSFGGDADEETSKKLFNRCREAGINFFDCANVYSGGKAEEILGRLVKGQRDKLILTTKVGMGADGGLSRRHILMEVENSLRRLGTDWIDVYFCHCNDTSLPMEETLGAMNDLVRQGKVRCLGVSNWPAWKMARSLGLCEQRGWPKFQVIQPMYSLAKRTAEIEILPLAREEGMGVIPFSPLGAGLLTGKYLGGKTSAGRLVANKLYAKRYENGAYHAIAEKFVTYAKEKGMHPATLAVAWVRANPAVTAPIIGARHVEQLESSLAAADYEMTPEEWKHISDLTPPVPVATDHDENRPNT